MNSLSAKVKEALSFDAKLSHGIEKSRNTLRLLDIDLEEAPSSSADGQVKEDSYAMFISLKSTCRLILKYLRDTLAESRDDNSVRLFEASLLEFEQTYRDFNSLTVHRQMPVLLRLIETKDKALYRTCNLLLGKLGIEYTVDYEISALATPEIRELIKVFSTFKALARSMKMVEFTTEDSDSATTLLKVQHKYSEQRKELTTLMDEHEELKRRYKAVSHGVGRQQVLVKQQERIDALETQNSKLNREIGELRSEHIRLIQSEGHSRDLMSQAQHHTKTLKLNAEKQSDQLRPQLQETIHSFQVEQKSLKNVKHAITSITERCQLLQNQLAEAECKVKKEQAAYNVFVQRQTADGIRIKALLDEVERQKRINSVVAAAKLYADDNYKLQLRINDGLNARLDSNNDKLRVAQSEQSRLTQDASKYATQFEIAQQKVMSELMIKGANEERITLYQTEIEEKSSLIQELHGRIDTFMAEKAIFMPEFEVLKEQLSIAKNENAVLQNTLRMTIKKHQNDLKKAGTQSMS